MSIELAILIILLGIWSVNWAIILKLDDIKRVLEQILEKTTYNQQVIDSNEKALNLLLTEFTKKYNTKEK